MSAISRLGEEVMEFCDYLVATFGEDVVLNDSIIIADILVNRDGATYNPIQYRASDPRRYIQVALLEEAKIRAEEMRDSLEDVPEGD